MLSLNKTLLLLSFCFCGTIVAQTTSSTALVNEEPASAPAATQQAAVLDGWQVADTINAGSAAGKHPRYRNPGKAVFRSAVLPGWGQVYNRRIWKVPVVYAGLGITAGLFVDNLKWLKRFRYAYSVAYNIQQGTDSLTGPNFAKVYQTLKGPFFTDKRIDLQGLGDQRARYHQYRDYSFVSFVLVWALNVVDAAVDAHLNSFDVSPGLSLKMSPSLLSGSNNIGMSLAVQLK